MIAMIKLIHLIECNHSINQLEQTTMVQLIKPKYKKGPVNPSAPIHDSIDAIEQIHA